ncbi:hypothetical protein [Staphylococcus phage Stab23]|nr:hypothetical protein [Staphylococcus phage Stab23]
MVKIKTKKQLNLPQLIEWAWKNIEQVEGKEFKSNVRDSFDNYSTVQFSVDGCGFKTQWVTNSDIFTVEVEKEIDEDTVIPKMLVIGRFDGYEEVYNQKLSSFSQHLLSAYLIHDDGFMELIYDEEKGLVG